nr:PREDICTED: YTH domain-containing family protein 2-like [Daucus carota subsp. sativus]
MERRRTRTTRSFYAGTNDRRMAETNSRSEYYEDLNPLGASSCSNKQSSSGYKSAGQSQILREFSSLKINDQRHYCAPGTRLNDKPKTQLWKVSNAAHMKEKCNIRGVLEATAHISRGPRGVGQMRKIVSDLPAVDKWKWLSVQRDDYNLQDFQTKYDNAKFYIIKAVSEDDIHKSIKYNVWSSTPYGNSKVNAAFLETQDETSEVDTACPIFLFYSVTESGQFVGVAEMIGKVDFAKDLNFWQTDDWNGFFPVMWHIIKDIPNTRLRHITIERNNKKPVTHTRDMQEIGLQQGLEMLKIFKDYTATTSILDDFSFYEKREQLLMAKRNKPASY